MQPEIEIDFVSWLCMDLHALDEKAILHLTCAIIVLPISSLQPARFINSYFTPCLILQALHFLQLEKHLQQFEELCGEKNAQQLRSFMTTIISLSADQRYAYLFLHFFSQVYMLWEDFIILDSGLIDVLYPQNWQSFWTTKMQLDPNFMRSSPKAICLIRIGESADASQIDTRRQVTLSPLFFWFW